MDVWGGGGLFKGIPYFFPFRGIILLIGGGYALAEGFTKSGLSQFLGESLEVLEVFPVFILLLAVCASISGLTELTSNVATANMLLPILATISIAIDQNPLLLMLSGTVACSYAFMLPVIPPPLSSFHLVALCTDKKCRSLPHPTQLSFPHPKCVWWI